MIALIVSIQIIADFLVNVEAQNVRDPILKIKFSKELHNCFLRIAFEKVKYYLSSHLISSIIWGEERGDHIFACIIVT